MRKMCSTSFKLEFAQEHWLNRLKSTYDATSKSGILKSLSAMIKARGLEFRRNFIEYSTSITWSRALDLVSATMMTIKLPKAMVRSHAAWTTAFIDDGACRKKYEYIQKNAQYVGCRRGIENCQIMPVGNNATSNKYFILAKVNW